MNDLDKTADNMASTTALTIIDYLRKEQGLSSVDMNESQLRADIAALLRDEHDDFPCHDWIGEALQRRQECADLIRARGEYYERACRAENMLARVLLQPENEPLREGARLLIKELNPMRPIPSEGNTKVLDPEVGKWVVFYPGEESEGLYVITSLSETLNIRGANNNGTLMDDIAAEYAVCHELGDAVLPEKTITWGKVIPGEVNNA